jgi:hypothetical protein
MRHLLHPADHHKRWLLIKPRDGGGRRHAGHGRHGRHGVIMRWESAFALKGWKRRFSGAPFFMFWADQRPALF